MTDESATHTRAYPPLPHFVDDRIGYIMLLMGQQLWERGDTGRELAAHWGIAYATVRDYAAEAARTIKRLGEREVWLDIVRFEAYRRLSGADDNTFPSIARLAMDTVGGFAQRHEVTHSVAQEPDEVLARKALEWIVSQPELHGVLLEAAAKVNAVLTEGTEQ